MARLIDSCVVELCWHHNHSSETNTNNNNSIGCSGAKCSPFIEAQLLLSLVNQWGSDVCLDRTLESSLGLVPVSGAVANGHFSSRFSTVSFQLPLHRPGDDHNSMSSDVHNGDTGRNNPIVCSQQLLAAVAVCHALNNLPEKQTQGRNTWMRLVRCLESLQDAPTTSTPEHGRRSAADSRTTMRQVCCLFATSLVTFTLPRLLMGSVPLTQLVLQQFLQKYQDRCLEVATMFSMYLLSLCHWLWTACIYLLGIFIGGGTSYYIYLIVQYC